jgi:hypothetical protein
VGIISDTHVPSAAARIPQDVLAALAGVSLILHAGDVTHQRALRQLGAIAPVEAVRGNCDSLALPATALVTVGGFTIGVAHRGPWDETPDSLARLFQRRVDCAVFGHAHVSRIARAGETLVLNPGSPTAPRDGVRSVMVLNVGDNLQPELIVLGAGRTGD